MAPGKLHAVLGHPCCIVVVIFQTSVAVVLNGFERRRLGQELLSNGRVGMNLVSLRQKCRGAQEERNNKKLHGACCLVDCLLDGNGAVRPKDV